MFLLKFMRGLWQHLTSRIAFNDMLSLNDHLLKDVGVTRDEVITANKIPLWKDPAEALWKMANEREKFDLQPFGADLPTHLRHSKPDEKAESGALDAFYQNSRTPLA
ncbi:hypothetical protein [Pelagibius sp. Alg239-R121]|uniref:hypothetical protein n=1 Tax=Pelagibius sp. Alg239-R121 TaxID=2993448 RepID=UPI0024A66A25|nr:hypothetical protein [Pelagibius sp. Alg239-R121]